MRVRWDIQFKTDINRAWTDRGSRLADVPWPRNARPYLRREEHRPSSRASGRVVCASHRQRWQVRRRRGWQIRRYHPDGPPGELNASRCRRSHPLARCVRRHFGQSILSCHVQSGAVVNHDGRGGGSSGGSGQRLLIRRIGRAIRSFNALAVNQRRTARMSSAR